MNRPFTAAEIEARSRKNKAAWPNAPQASNPPPVATLTAEHGDGGARPTKKTPIGDVTVLGWPELQTDETDLLGRYDLPYPPTINTYWRNLGEGRTVLSRGAREYRKAVMELIGAAVPVRDRLRIEIELYPPDKRRRDLDNVTKSLFDCMQHACVFHDDSQIDEYRIKRMPVVAGGRCLVTLYLMKG